MKFFNIYKWHIIIALVIAIVVCIFFVVLDTRQNTRQNNNLLIEKGKYLLSQGEYKSAISAFNSANRQDLVEMAKNTGFLYFQIKIDSLIMQKNFVEAAHQCPLLTDLGFPNIKYIHEKIKHYANVTIQLSESKIDYRYNEDPFVTLTAVTENAICINGGHWKYEKGLYMNNRENNPTKVFVTDVQDFHPKIVSYYIAEIKVASITIPVRPYYKIDQKKKANF
jgi:hypothetical protein